MLFSHRNIKNPGEKYILPHRKKCKNQTGLSENRLLHCFHYNYISLKYCYALVTKASLELKLKTDKALGHIQICPMQTVCT